MSRQARSTTSGAEAGGSVPTVAELTLLESRRLASSMTSATRLALLPKW